MGREGLSSARDSQSHALPIASLASLEVSQGVHSRVPEYALSGAGIGAACGVVVGAVRSGQETWKPVNLARLPVGVTIRTGKDPALGLSLRF